MDFRLSTKDNPFSFFDELYAINGLNKIEQIFHNIYGERMSTPHCKYDEKEKTYHLYEQYTDEGDYEMNQYSFLDFLKIKINKESKLAKESFNLRMKSCNSSKEQQFALKICINSINRSQNFLKSNDVLFKPNHNNFLKKLREIFVKIYKKNEIDYIEPVLTKITSDKSKEELLGKIQKSLQIFSGMDDVVLFKTLVLSKVIPIADDRFKINISCELWVFKTLLKRIKLKFDLSWKYSEIEASGIFWDAKKNKLITAKRLTDAKPKSANKQHIINEKFDEIF